MDMIRPVMVRAEMFGQLTTGLESAWNKLKGFFRYLVIVNPLSYPVPTNLEAVIFCYLTIPSHTQTLMLGGYCLSQNIFNYISKITCFTSA